MAYRMFRAASAPLLMLLQLISAPVQANDVKSDEPEKVVVSGMRNPDLKNYRIMHAGVLAFEKNHQRAPQAAEVRFKLRARKIAGLEPYDSLTLRLVGDDTSVNLPFDSNNSFSLPPKNVVADEDADLVLNKRKGGYSWLPVVRSAGVPERMRRMGDLRLECQVMIATVKQEIGLMKTAFLNSVLLTTNWCMLKHYEDVNLPSFSDRPLAGATLVDGNKRTELKIEDDRIVFIAPLADTKVSDDALVELRYADAVPTLIVRD
jgi:hypothetical protein